MLRLSFAVPGRHRRPRDRVAERLLHPRRAQARDLHPQLVRPPPSRSLLRPVALTDPRPRSGDILSRWSNDALKSTVHRAVLPDLRDGEDADGLTKTRRSIAFFCNARPHLSPSLSYSSEPDTILHVPVPRPLPLAIGPLSPTRTPSSPASLASRARRARPSTRRWSQASTMHRCSRPRSVREGVDGSSGPERGQGGDGRGKGALVLALFVLLCSATRCDPPLCTTRERARALLRRSRRNELSRSLMLAVDRRRRGRRANEDAGNCVRGGKA